MPAAVRLGDYCTGHGKAGPRPNLTASSDVLINGIGAHRVGDIWSYHKGHLGVQATGSPNVFVNGFALARVSDNINCGSKNARGSTNVIVN